MPDRQDVILNIKRIFTPEEFAGKTLLVREGSLAKKLFYIEKGSCRVWFNHDGKEVTFQFLFEGKFATSIESLVNRAPSWYSIETLEPVMAYSISLEELRNKMQEFGHVKEFYYSYIQQQLLVYQQLFASRIRDSPEKRYLELLQQFPEIVQRIPQHYVASYLGVTPVSLSRIRNRR